MPPSAIPRKVNIREDAARGVALRKGCSCQRDVGVPNRGATTSKQCRRCYCSGKEADAAEASPPCCLNRSSSKQPTRESEARTRSCFPCFGARKLKPAYRVNCGHGAEKQVDGEDVGRFPQKKQAHINGYHFPQRTTAEAYSSRLPVSAQNSRKTPLLEAVSIYNGGERHAHNQESLQQHLRPGRSSHSEKDVPTALTSFKKQNSELFQKSQNRTSPVISSKSVSLLKKPRSILKPAQKSSPPMNISSPQAPDMFGRPALKRSPANTPLKCPTPQSKQDVHAQSHLHTQGPKGCRQGERANALRSGAKAKGTERVSGEGGSLIEDKQVVWREGLLQRLGRLHGLGNCKLSLEELIELDDKSCLDKLERWHLQRQENEQKDPSEGNVELLPLGGSLALSSSATPKRSSMASMWNMEFEGGRPVLPLQKQDMSPDRMASRRRRSCRSHSEDGHWRFSHTNCLFEAPASSHLFDTYDDCR
ncbi:hypothetical protein KP509_04G112100 [Ceratopteris richardii]|uniref:Uncharacterized protein n=1 Tax=Ceratopteris richardii TaxID=49495 RepID=A0A8T2V899_CERRI|nr:hypothetical protein KP509_04G112100 [Ceratopteris richardii]